MRRQITGLVSALAIAGFVMPAAASAGEGPLQWWYHGAPIPLGNTVELTSFGHKNPVTLHLAPSGASVTCNIRFTDTLTDTSREVPGSDQMVQVTFAKCTQGGAAAVCPSPRVEVIAAGLPWASHLESEYFAPGEANNLIEGVDLEIRCGGSSVAGKFTGTLRSIVRPEHVRKKLCTFFVFPGESALSGETGTLGVSGPVRMEPKCVGQIEARPPIK